MNSPTNPIPDPPHVVDSVVRAVGENIATRLEEVVRSREEATPDFEFPGDVEESHKWRCEGLRSHFKPHEADRLRMQVSKCESTRTA